MKEIGTWLLDNLGTLITSGVISSFLSIRITRRKLKAEVETTEATAKGSELDNVEKAISIYREMVEDLKKELNSHSDKLLILENNACFDPECKERKSIRA